MKGGRLVMILAGLSGALGVAAGAFAAHKASGEAARWLRTGGEYQLIHAAAAVAATHLRKGQLAAWLFVIGSAIFAGTLYAMALGWPHWLGAVTPIGGMTLIIAWIVLAFAAMR